MIPEFACQRGPGDGPGPVIPRYRTLVPVGLPLVQAVATLLLMETLRLMEDGGAARHAGVLVPVQWQQTYAIYVSHN